MRFSAFPAIKRNGVLLVLLALVMTVAATHAVYAQTSTANNPVGYTSADNPHGPLMMPGWAAGMGAACALSGVGVWTAVRRK